MKVSNLIAFGLNVLVGLLIWRLAGHAALPPSSRRATEPGATDKVVATVNGEPICESELMAGIPDDAFQAQSDELKTSKLRRLVEEAVEWQFSPRTRCIGNSMPGEGGRRFNK